MNPTARRLLAFTAAALVAIPTLASAATLSLRAGNPNLSNAARGLGKGAGLEIRGLKLAGEDIASTLKMERFDVWRQDAIVEVDGRRVSPPASAYFKGTVDGDASSVAMLSVRESGEVQGIVQKGGKSWVVGKGRTQRFLKSRKADRDELAPFECGNDHALTPEQRLGVEDAPVAAATGTVLDQPYVANIAIETDYEYYAKFGNTTNALDYMGDLIGYADLVYSREINTDMQIGFSRLFTGGATTDPWNATADTSSALTEFRNYWNTNMRQREPHARAHAVGQGPRRRHRLRRRALRQLRQQQQRLRLRRLGQPRHQLQLGRRPDPQPGRRGLGHHRRAARDRPQLQLAAHPRLLQHRRRRAADRQLLERLPGGRDRRGAELCIAHPVLHERRRRRHDHELLPPAQRRLRQHRDDLRRGPHLRHQAGARGGPHGGPRGLPGARPTRPASRAAAAATASSTAASSATASRWAATPARRRASPAAR